MRKAITAVSLSTALLFATPAVANAAPSVASVSVHEAKIACVQTSFWGRFASLFISRSYAAYLWQVKC